MIGVGVSQKGMQKKVLLPVPGTSTGMQKGMFRVGVSQKVGTPKDMVPGTVCKNAPFLDLGFGFLKKVCKKVCMLGVGVSKKLSCAKLV